MPGAIPRATLGRTGLEVTRLGFGAMEIRGSRIWNGRPVTESQAETILNAVLDSGINFIDTSNDYGRSEEFIGKYISGRRDEYYLATKCGCLVVPTEGPADKTDHVWTRENVFRCLHESLRRLRTDYVDVMQLHGPPTDVCSHEGLVRALNDMRDQGRVRWIGNSSTLPYLPDYIDSGDFDTFQVPYSALQREHELLITRAAEAGAGTIVRGGVAKGEGRGPADTWKKFGEGGLGELLGIGESRSGFLLRYALTHPSVHTIIVGTLSAEHLAGNVRELVDAGPLPADVYAEVKRRMDSVDERPQ